MKEMRYVWVLAVVCVLCLVLVQGARGDNDCPPTDTPIPPPSTAVPPTEVVEPTPSSPPPATYPPTDEPTPSSPPEWTGTPWLQTQYPPTATLGVTPDPTATETPEAGETPRAGQRPAPTKTPVTTLPVTGGGLPPNVALGLTAAGIVALLGVAMVARAGRRQGR